jgi:RNA polymerase sigma factor (sigma-70 family)
MILRVAARTGLTQADAADAQQATWIQLMRRADQVREPDRIGAWLATTARRESQRIAIAACRQQPSADPRSEYECDEHVSRDTEAVVLHSHYAAALDRALKRLPRPYRRVLQLLSSDLVPSYEEVAKAMAVPVGSIGPMRMRALQILRRDPGLQRYRRLPSTHPLAADRGWLD